MMDKDISNEKWREKKYNLNTIMTNIIIIFYTNVTQILREYIYSFNKNKKRSLCKNKQFVKQ